MNILQQRTPAVIQIYNSMLQYAHLQHGLAITLELYLQTIQNRPAEEQSHHLADR